jgi:hypothetical protein
MAIHYAAKYNGQFTYDCIAVQTNTFYGSWWVGTVELQQPQLSSTANDAAHKLYCQNVTVSQHTCTCKCPLEQHGLACGGLRDITVGQQQHVRTFSLPPFTKLDAKNIK